MSEKLNKKIGLLIVALETHYEEYKSTYGETNFTPFEQTRTRKLLNQVNEFAYQKFLDTKHIVVLRKASKFLQEEGVDDVPDFTEESPTYSCYRR